MKAGATRAAPEITASSLAQLLSFYEAGATRAWRPRVSTREFRHCGLRPSRPGVA
jgi:hypothetical protein